MNRDEVRRLVTTGEADMTDPETRDLVKRALGISAPKDDGSAFLEKTLAKLDAAKRAPAKRSAPPAAGRIDSSLPPPPRPRNHPNARLVSWNGHTAIYSTIPKES